MSRLTLVAGIGQLAMGHVDVGLLGWLLRGSIPGIALESLASNKAPEPVLRGAIAFVPGDVGLKLML